MLPVLIASASLRCGNAASKRSTPNRLFDKFCKYQKRSKLYGAIHRPIITVEYRQFSSTFLGDRRAESKAHRRDRSAQPKTQGNTGKNRDKLMSLDGIFQRTEDLIQRISKLEPLPLSSMMDLSTSDYQERLKIFSDTKKLVEDIQEAVEGQKIHPSRKHGTKLSLIMGNVFKLYSAVPANENHSAFDECLSVLSLLDKWNLSRQAQHFHYAILTAIHEQRWEDASSLFLQQMNPELSGFAPIEMSVSSPVGLYAIARAAQERGFTPVEEVLDAVLNLTLLSPSEQEKYVLAAGTALGLTGEWKGLVGYLENSYNASRLGQPLVAAAMHACILCNQYDEAVRIYQSLTGKKGAISSEFHWGGEQYQVSPLCRDLAMRAIGRSTQPEGSDEAIHLFRQVVEDELTISDEALVGVIDACEKDGNWRDAVGVFITYLDNLRDQKMSGWVVPSADLSVPQIHEDARYLDKKASSGFLYEANGELLSSIMRTCNSSNEPGIALLCFMLLDAALVGTCYPKDYENSQNLCGYGPIEQSLFSLLVNATNAGQLLSVTLVSLCGVGCFQEAANLFVLATQDVVGNRGRRLRADEMFYDAEVIYSYARTQKAKRRDSTTWESAHRHIHRLSRALGAVGKKNIALTTDQRWMISSALGAAINSCTLAGQPETGLLLSERVKFELSLITSLTDDSTSIFMGRNNDTTAGTIIINDSFLSEQMRSLQAADKGGVALDLFKSTVDSLNQWPQSINAAMAILAEKDEMEEAIRLFRSLVDQTPNIDSFLTVAEIFADADQWSSVADVYHMAIEKGYLSERLGLLAMKAVIETKVPSRLRVLRSIINETSESIGTNPVDWMETNYWRLKDLLGFSEVRLLMWWNDPRTCHLDELQFAIDTFEKRTAAGLKPRNGTVRLIVSHASESSDKSVPQDKKELVRVPRNRDDWEKLLRRVLDETDSSLMSDSNFIDDVALALRRLKCEADCVKFVQDAMLRGVRVRQIAIREASRAADAAGIPEEAESIRLMVMDNAV